MKYYKMILTAAHIVNANLRDFHPLVKYETANLCLSLKNAQIIIFKAAQ